MSFPDEELDMEEPEEEGKALTVNELVEKLGMEREVTQDALHAEYMRLVSEQRLMVDWGKALEDEKQDPINRDVDFTGKDAVLSKETALTETRLYELLNYIKHGDHGDETMVEILEYLHEGGAYDNLYDITKQSAVINPMDEETEVLAVQPAGPEYYSADWTRALDDRQLSAKISNKETREWRPELYPDEPRRVIPTIPDPDVDDRRLYSALWMYGRRVSHEMHNRVFKGLPAFNTWHARRMHDLGLAPEPGAGYPGLITKLGPNPLGVMKLIWAWDGDTPQSFDNLFEQLAKKRHPLASAFHKTLIFLVRHRFIRTWKESRDVWRVLPLFTGPTSPTVGLPSIDEYGVVSKNTPLDAYNMALMGIDEDRPLPLRGRFQAKTYPRRGDFFSRIAVLTQGANRGMPFFVNPTEWEPPITKDWYSEDRGAYTYTYNTVIEGSIPFDQSAQLAPEPNAAYSKNEVFSIHGEWATILNAAFRGKLDTGHFDGNGCRGGVIVAVDRTIGDDETILYKRQAWAIMRLPPNTFDHEEVDYGPPFGKGHFVVVFADLQSKTRVLGRWLASISAKAP